MVDQARFVAALQKSFEEGTMDPFIASCQNPYKGCEDGVKLAPGDAATLRGVMMDGIVTQDERLKLRKFLPVETIRSIAGDDGKKPLRLKGSMLIGKLAKAKLEDAAPILKEIVKLGPEVRDQFLPIAKTLLERLISEIPHAKRQDRKLDGLMTRLMKQRDRLDERQKALRDALPDDSCTCKETAAMRAARAKIAALERQRNALNEEINHFSKKYGVCYYKEYLVALRTLTTFLGSFQPPPDFLAPAILKGIEDDKGDTEIAAVTVDALVAMKHPTAPRVMRVACVERTYEHCDETILRAGTPDDVRKSFVDELGESQGKLLSEFVERPRPELEVVIVEELMRSATRKVHESKLQRVLANLTYTSLLSIVEAHKDDEASALAVREMGRRFSKEKDVTRVLHIALRDEVFPKTAEAAMGALLANTTGAATDLKVKIINGEGKINEELRDELVKRCDSSFIITQGRAGKFTERGKLLIRGYHLYHVGF